MAKVTLSTLNTRSGSTSSKYSDYWLDDIYDKRVSAYQYGPDTDENASLEKVIRLAGVRRAVANFVRILTNDPRIRVKFNSGNDSYTDGKTVVIAAQEDRADFDVMVGLALHEASHCLKTDMGVYQFLVGDDSIYSYVPLTLTPIAAAAAAHRCFHPELRRYLGDAATNPNLKSAMQLLLNIVEDRRIDHFVYTTATGYRPYYMALYDKYFLSKEIDKALLNDPLLFKPTLDAYLNRIINIMNPNASPKALKGLAEMYEVFDLNHIGRLMNESAHPDMEIFYMYARDAVKRAMFENAGRKVRRQMSSSYYYTADPELLKISADQLVTALGKANYDLTYTPWKMASELLLLIVRETGYDFTKTLQETMGKGAGESAEGDENDAEGDDEGEGDDEESDLDNLDLDRPGSGKYNRERSRKAFDKQRNFLKGDTRKKKITAGVEKIIEQVEQSGANIVEVGGKTGLPCKVPVVVLNQVSEALLRSEWFTHGVGPGDHPYMAQQYDPYISAGVRMGQVLVNRLQIRNDPRMTLYNRQKHGRIDRRNLSLLGMDIVNVFMRSRTENFKPVLAHISLDASGSMCGEKWGRALTVAVAMSYLAEKVKSIDVVITIRGSAGNRGSYGSSGDSPLLAVIHDSRRQRFVTARKLFSLCRPNGGTPEALCFEAMLDLITKNGEKTSGYFVNLSDGEPAWGCRGDESFTYSGTIAAEHCRKVMHLVRGAGIRVLSYFVSGYSRSHDDMFRRSYGQDAQFINVQNVTEILQTLQRFFSSRGDVEVVNQ